VTPVDNCTWIPSVSGLLREAESVTPCIFIFWQPLMTIWNILIPWSLYILFDLVNPNDYKIHNEIKSDWFLFYIEIKKQIIVN
jgi:hypothetical protein